MMNLLLFLATFLSAFAQSDWRPAADCRANIRAVACRVRAKLPGEQVKLVDDRVCQTPDEVLLVEIEKVHDLLPDKLRNMFCSLRRINLEEDDPGIAYTTVFIESYRDAQGVEMIRRYGFTLGLNMRRAFGDINEITSRKYQELIGREFREALLPAAPFPEVKARGVKGNVLLLTAIIHEFGHMLETANDLIYMTSRDCDFSQEDPHGANCRFLPGGVWASLSWDDFKEIRAIDRIFGIGNLCFYDCVGGPDLKEDQLRKFFEKFIAHQNFVSAYAMASAVEDFAETFEHYVIGSVFNDSERAVEFGIHFPESGETRKISLNPSSDGRLGSKWRYMNDFWNSEWEYIPAPVETRAMDIRLPPKGRDPL